MTDNPNLTQFLDRLEKLSDETRTEAKNKRHKLGLRTARENLDHLVDNKSFLEYGAFAVAAQRNRRKYENIAEAYYNDEAVRSLNSGETKKGIQYLESGLKLLPNSSVLRRNLNLASQKKGHN